jgi:hypothetical protein
MECLSPSGIVRGIPVALQVPFIPWTILILSLIIC